MSLKSWLVRWIYPALMKTVADKEAADTWTAHIARCKFCERPLLIEAQFCPHCGYSLTERHTTGQVPLIDTPVIDAPVACKPGILTGQIESALKPGEKHAHLRAYIRLKQERKV